MAHMHPQRIEKYPSSPNILISMASFYHILPPFSYLIKLNKWNISSLCYATLEYEVWTIPNLEEMPLSFSTVNKLSLNTQYFIRECLIMVASPLDGIKGLNTMLQGMNQPSQNQLWYVDLWLLLHVQVVTVGCLSFLYLDMPLFYCRFKVF